MIDKSIKEKIRENFYDEYMHRAEASRPDLVARIKDDGKNMLNLWGGAFCAHLVLSFAAFLTFPPSLGYLVPLLISPAVCFGGAYAYQKKNPTARSQLCDVQQKMLDDDIDNGTLLKRYRNETIPRALEDIQTKQKMEKETAARTRAAEMRAYMKDAARQSNLIDEELEIQTASELEKIKKITDSFIRAGSREGRTTAPMPEIRKMPFQRTPDKSQP